MAMEFNPSLVIVGVSEPDEKSSSQSEKSSSTTDEKVSLKSSSTTDEKSSSQSERSFTTDSSQKSLSSSQSQKLSTGDHMEEVDIEFEVDNMEEEDELNCRKRKIDDDDEDSDTSYYEATSSDEDYGDDDEEEDSYDEEVPILDFHGELITNEQLIHWMDEDNRPLEVKLGLINKIRKYFKSITDSDGFECSHFPGYIWGLTNMGMRPRQSVIRNRDKYPEDYNHMLYLSSLAVDDYNKKNDVKYVVMDIEKVSFSWTKGKIFYITFLAQNSITGGKDTFQSMVWDELKIDCTVEVKKCRLKPPTLTF